MFVPELVRDDECILVHNHYLMSEESAKLSIMFSRARAKHARRNLPSEITNLKIVFDVEGQSLDSQLLRTFNSENLEIDSVEFLGVD